MAIRALQVNRVNHRVAEHLDHRSPRVRNEAVRGVDWLKQDDGIALLIDRSSDEHSTVRETAARQLGHTAPINDRTAIAALNVLLQQEAARLEPRKQWPLQWEDLGFGLREATRVDVMCEAIRSLGSIGNDTVADTLFRLTGDAEEEIRDEAIIALAQIGDKRSVQPFCDLLTHRDTRRRDTFLLKVGRTAASAQSGSGNKIALTPIRKALLARVSEEASPSVRRWLARSLQGFSDAATITALHKLCADESHFLRIEALRILVDTDDSDRFQILEESLNDKTPSVRSAGLRHYSRIHGNAGHNSPLDPVKSVNTISQLLNDPNADVRMNVVRALIVLEELAPEKVAEHSETVIAISNNDSELQVRELAKTLLAAVQSTREGESL